MIKTADLVGSSESPTPILLDKKSQVTINFTEVGVELGTGLEYDDLQYKVAGGVLLTLPKEKRMELITKIVTCMGKVQAPKAAALKSPATV